MWKDLTLEVGNLLGGVMGPRPTNRDDVASRARQKMEISVTEEWLLGGELVQTIK